LTQTAMMSAEEVTAFLDKEFPQLHYGGRTYHIEDVGHRSARMRLTYAERHLRPGGTISGPSMFALADLALYVAVGLAVTTNLNINFLMKPAQRDLIGECRLLKLGKRLAVGEVTLFSEGSTEPVAHATGTYAIPPQ
jgi:uncharacterized protein (TIGR00369 family)